MWRRGAAELHDEAGHGVRKSNGSRWSRLARKAASIGREGAGCQSAPGRTNCPLGAGRDRRARPEKADKIDNSRAIVLPIQQNMSQAGETKSEGKALGRDGLGRDGLGRDALGRDAREEGIWTGRPLLDARGWCATYSPPRRSGAARLRRAAARHEASQLDAARPRDVRVASAMREAIKLLAGKGLIESAPRRGTVVRPRTSWNGLDRMCWPGRRVMRRTPPSSATSSSCGRMIEPEAAAYAAQRATPSAWPRSRAPSC